MAAQPGSWEAEQEDRANLKEAWRSAFTRLNSTPRWRLRKRARAHRAARVAHRNVLDEGIHIRSNLPRTTRSYAADWLVGFVVMSRQITKTTVNRTPRATLDPMPDGVTQHGTTFTVPLGLEDNHADPDHLCARLSGDDDPVESHWLAGRVTTQGNYINVRCLYDDGF